MIDPEVRTYLSVLEADRRTVRLHFSTPEPLRARAGKSRRRQLQDLRSEVRKAAQNRFVGRAPYRGQVSIEADFFLHTAHDVSTYNMVKAYLDALKGIVYADDVSVGHLMVMRENLRPDDRRPEWPDDLPFTPPTSEATEVFMVIKPLRIYQEQFDRAYHHESLTTDWSDPFDFAMSDLSPWELSGDEPDDPFELLATAREVQNEFPSLSPIQHHQLAEAYERWADKARTEWVTRASFSARDRPGGSPEQFLAGRLPGDMLLPGPHRASQPVPWVEQLEQEIRKHQTKLRLLERPLRGPVGVDIAVPISAPAKDLDNLAHAVIRSIEKVLFQPVAESISTYRVYRVNAPSERLHVRLMNPRHMRSLPDAIQHAHRAYGGRAA